MKRGKVLGTRIVIYDSNNGFAERFVNFLEHNEKFQVVMFTNLDKLEMYIESNLSDFYILEDLELTRQLITKNNIKAMLMSEDRELEEIGVFRFIYRYTSMPQIIDKMKFVMHSFNSDKNEEDEFKVFSLVSPFHRFDVDQLLLKLISKFDEKVLVIDFRMDRFWMDNMTKDSSEEHSLSDVLFSTHEKSDNLNNYIKEKLSHIENVDILCGLVEETDISAISQTDIDNLIKAIMSLGIYKRSYLVLESGLLEIISKSVVAGSLVVLTRDEKEEQQMLKRYESRGITFLDKVNCNSKGEIIDKDTYDYLV